MKNALQRALEDCAESRSNLQAALAVSTSMEGLEVLRLVRKAAKLSAGIAAVIAAVESDEKGGIS